jgi:hypothetical protein
MTVVASDTSDAKKAPKPRARGSGSPLGPAWILIPVYLEPGFAANAGHHVVLPGLHLRPVSPEASKRVQQDLRLTFAPRCLIELEPEPFEAAARERLEPSRCYVPMALSGADEGRAFVEGLSVAKWITTGLVLTKSFAFVVGPVYRLRHHTNHVHAQKLAPTKWSQPDLIGVADYRFAGMPQPDLSVPFDFDQFQGFVCLLEPYFRPGVFRMDRLAVALTSLWNSLCTVFPDQAYTSLSVAVEALVSTQPDGEISHQLAERIACLLATPESKPIQIYRRVKRLYGTRSDIVHGRGLDKEDRKKLRNLAKKNVRAVPKDYPLRMHPLDSAVPINDLRDLTGITIDTIQEFLAFDPLREAIQEHDDDKVNRIFLEMLLGWEVPEYEPRPTSREP